MSLRYEEKGMFSNRALVQSMGLVVSLLLVTVFYTVIVRPLAEKAEVAKSFGLAEGVSGGGSFFVLIKDVEQQMCFVLLGWALFLIAYKFWVIWSEKHSPELDTLLEESSDAGIEPALAGKLTGKLEGVMAKNRSWQTKILPYLVLSGLKRFVTTHSPQEATECIKGRVDVSAEKLETELSLIRYIAWAIPSIGFIGTVRGIGEALSRADEAIAGDIAGVTGALGVAFNSTLVALLISIVLMFLIHALQAAQEKLIINLETYCRETVLDRLVVQKPRAS